MAKRKNGDPFADWIDKRTPFEMAEILRGVWAEIGVEQSGADFYQSVCNIFESWKAPEPEEEG